MVAVSFIILRTSTYFPHNLVFFPMTVDIDTTMRFTRVANVTFFITRYFEYNALRVSICKNYTISDCLYKTVIRAIAKLFEN